MVGNNNNKAMKNLKFIYTLLAATLFVTACSDEELINEGRVPVADGSEIIFGGRAGFESSAPEGRTVYTGDVYNVGTKKFERINWVDGDNVEIYCKEASNGPSAHYSINNIKNENITTGNYGYLERMGESSLQWNGDVTHNFYAMYPSASMFPVGSTVAQGIFLSESGGNIIVNGTVPTSQPAQDFEDVKEDDGTNVHVVKPDMKYAYMVAKSSVKRSDLDENEGVGLSFVPIVTALEIEMIVPAGANANQKIHPVQIGEIKITGNGIAGNFTANLSSSWVNGYPVCTNAENGENSIIISTWNDHKPIEVNEGEKVRFTVFLRPGADYSNLQIGFSPQGSGYLNKTLQGKTIPKNLKTRVKNLYLPATFDAPVQVDASRWMDQIADKELLKALSIPGTGGSFTASYNGDNASWYKQQTLNFEEQWTLGIRAFEIVSNRPSSTTESLGSQAVKCNGAAVDENTTVLSVLKDLLAKVNKGVDTEVVDANGKPSTVNVKTETAVLILTYQPEGASPNRNGAAYAQNLKLLYDGLNETQKGQIISYTPKLTLGEARGKVMIFCRINQRDETDNGDTSEKKAFQLASETLAGTNITLIDGCGTAKDRWGARGYKVKGNVAWDIAHTDDSNRSVDYYLSQHGSILSYSFPDWSNVTKPEKLNFGFSTNTAYTCWYQEWARVVPSDIIGTSGYYQYSRIGGDYRWYESYTEKLNAAKTSFDMALSGSAEYSDHIFINSLCGYFVDKSIDVSCKLFTGGIQLGVGGSAGNINALAKKINVDFYQYVLGSGYEQKTGPTGIVMMDYVSNTPTTDTTIEYDGAYFLPGVIISNNFKGNLATKPVTKPKGEDEEEGI